MDRVLEALTASIAALETVLQQHQNDRSAGNALEEIAYRLGDRHADERRAFDTAVERVAVRWETEDPDRGQRDWVRQMPGRLGLS